MRKDQELAERFIEELQRSIGDTTEFPRDVHFLLLAHDGKLGDEAHVRLLSGVWGLDHEVFLGELRGHRGAVRFMRHRLDPLVSTGFIVRDGGGYRLLTIVRDEPYELAISAHGQIRTRAPQPRNEQHYLISQGRWRELQPWIDKHLDLE